MSVVSARQGRRPSVLESPPTEATTPELRLPQLVRFEIEGPLSGGAQGQVFIARDRARAGQRVALKVAPKPSDPHEHRALIDEFFVARRARHPNIVGVLDAGESREWLWMSLELVDGVDLRAAAERPDFGVEARLDALITLGRALAYTHRLGIVHRDVKPANVLVARDGRVRLLDFGIAQLVGKDDRPAALGTPRYVAPEVAMAEPSDGRADVFALGVMAFELFTGRHPWVDDDVTDPKQVLMSIVASAPRPLMNTPILPQLELGEAEVFKLSAAIGRAIYADARRRHRTADELADTFEAVLRARAP